MDEIEQRLRETSEACIKNYETWSKDQKNADAREALQDAVHELRRVASRVEIEIAVSERSQMSDRPLPIPPHRSSNRRGGEQGDHQGGGNDDVGSENDNRGNNSNAGNSTSSSQGQGARPQFSRSGPPRGRRPMHGGGGRPKGDGNNT